MVNFLAVIKYLIDFVLHQFKHLNCAARKDAELVNVMLLHEEEDVKRY